MDLNDIYSTHSKHPWASEATLQSLVSIMGVNNSALMRLAKRLDVEINDIDLSDNKIQQQTYTQNIN